MSKGRPPRERSPQEKKALSLEKDRRNTYAENDKASRKLVPLRKAQAVRSGRRTAKGALTVLDRLDESDAEVVESSIGQDVERVTRWRKEPAEPLGDVLSKKAARRIAEVNAKARRRVRQAQFMVLLSGKPRARD